jgi:hypothetical protein
MNSPRPVKNSCTTCGKMAGVFFCRGCSGNFCLRHTNVHRELLQKSMNEIVQNYEQFKRNIQEYNIEQYQQILIEQIDRWEKQSLEKIHQLADYTRQQLVTIIRDQNENFNEKFDHLKEQIELARQDGGFYENDLREWSERLNQLQRNFIDQQAIKIDEEVSAISFIPKICINVLSNDQDETSSSPYEDYSPLNGKDEYSSGKHLLRFKIDQYESNSSILLGITSKSVSNISNPYKNPTFYGWTEKNLVYLAGNPEEKFNGYESDFQTNDTYVLTIDCNEEIIHLTNVRTNRSYSLDVDLRKCPFPWELNVHLFNDGD